jgi:hypothetical protein
MEGLKIRPPAFQLTTDSARFQVPVTDDYESQLGEENMKRFLPIAQLIVGFAIVPQAFLFGALGTLPLLQEVLTGGRFRPGFRGTQASYTWAVLLASVFVDAAAILCLASAVSLIRKPSRWGVRLSIAGAVCYGAYIAGHLLMISTLPGGLRVEFTLFDAADYLVGIIAALVTVVLYFNYKVHSAPASTVTS